MPLVVRYIEPRSESHPSTKASLCRPGPEDVQPHPEDQEYKEVDKLLTMTSCMPILESVSTNPLQALMVHRLASTIRQLSSLSQHAEGVMGAIADGLASCHSRSTQLEARMRRLREEVLPSLDPDLEATEGFEIPHPDFQFKSRRESNQLMLSKHPPPPPLALTIQAAHTPPLNSFSSLWPDGRDALHMYSNPSYFFEQWMSSVKKGALRRKSSGHILSPTLLGRPSGIPGGRFDSTGSVSPIGGSKKLKRSATVVSRSIRKKKTRPLSYYSSSNQSIDMLGLSSSSKQKGLQRSYSVRVSPGYTAMARKGVKIPKSKHLADPLSKSIAAVFPQIEVTPADLPEVDNSSTKSDKASTKSDSSSKFQRGGLRRSFSLRRSRSRSRSKSPNPTPVRATPDSVLSSNQMRTVEGSAKSSSSDLTVLPKKQLEQLELGTTGFNTTLTKGDNPKATSTFKAASNLSNRSVAPLLTRISTPPNFRVQTGSDAVRDRHNRSPIQRSMTIAGHSNANLRNAAVRAREKLKIQDRPSSVIDMPFSGRESPLLGMASSQTSLNRTPSAQSNSTGRPQSMLLAVGDFERPLSQELQAKMTISSQSRKPRRPAPPRPPSADSGGRSTPDSAKKRRVTPVMDSSPFSMASPDAGKAESDSSSPIQTTSQQTDSSPIPSKTKLDSSVEKTDSTLVNGDPSPPLQRQDSLSRSANSKTAQGPITGSGPATPGTAHTAVAQTSSLDADRRQSVAMALSEVLSNMSRRSNPLSPTSPLLVNGDLNRTITPENSASLDRILSPVTPQGKGSFDLNSTLTPFEHSPHFGMSPLYSFNTPNSSIPSGSFGKSSHVPPSKRRFSKRASSLYVSPHKIMSPRGSQGESSKQPNEILKAGGVDIGVLKHNRSDLLVAIRRGTQLKKVEEEAALTKAEVSWDVAAILDRYDVLHSDSDEDSDVGDDEWMDDFDN